MNPSKRFCVEISRAEEQGIVIVPANYNSPVCVIIFGNVKVVKKACKISRGAYRILSLVDGISA